MVRSQKVKVGISQINKNMFLNQTIQESDGVITVSGTAVVMYLHVAVELLQMGERYSRGGGRRRPRHHLAPRSRPTAPTVRQLTPLLLLLRRLLCPSWRCFCCGDQRVCPSAGVNCGAPLLPADPSGSSIITACRTPTNCRQQQIVHNAYQLSPTKNVEVREPQA